MFARDESRMAPKSNKRDSVDQIQPGVRNIHAAAPNTKTALGLMTCLSPSALNYWLRLFRVIMNEAVDELGLPRNPVLKVKGLVTSTHVTYTEEEPNALLPEEVGPSLAAMRDRHPQHLGMVALGFATGWRPSMMRPLRRKGPSADVLWEKNVVLARRSQTRGDEDREA